MKGNQVLDEHNLKTATVCLSLCFYIGSLCLPCYTYTTIGRDPGGNHIGFELLLSGGFFMLCKFWPGMIWLANLLLFLSLAKISKAHTSLFASSMALILSLCFLLVGELKRVSGGLMENGSFAERITGYGIGYWLWLLSSAIVCVGNIIQLKLPVEKVSE